MTAESRAHWSNVAMRLMLQPGQIMTLLRYRQNTIEALDHIYAKRKAIREELKTLSTQALEMLREGKVTILGGKDGSDAGGDDKFHIIPWTAELGSRSLACFDDLKQNFEAEQTVMMMMNMEFLHQILTPLQATRFLVDALPEHAHVMPLANLMVDTCARMFQQSNVSGGLTATAVGGGSLSAYSELSNALGLGAEHGGPDGALGGLLPGMSMTGRGFS